MSLNPTKIRPVEYRVLVIPDEVEEQEGSIYLPESVVAKQTEMRAEGILVDKGGMAFSDWKGEPIPKLGDHVVFNKYSGMVYRTRDKIQVRIMNDKDICAVLEETGNGAGVRAAYDII